MIVVKIGGGEGINYDAILSDIAALGEEVIIVHGGNAELARLSKQLGREQRTLRFSSGHVSRYTDRKTMELFEMVYCGKINKMIVEKLHLLGKRPIGLSGLDGALLVGRRKETLIALIGNRRRVIRDDMSGRLEGVNTELLHVLMKLGYVPVISPPALSNECLPINVDGDRAAAMIAARMGARVLVILSAVPGLLKDPGDESSLITTINSGDMERMQEFAKGSMKRKLIGAGEALAGGVGTVIIADARVDLPVTRALAGSGTHIRRPKQMTETAQPPLHELEQHYELPVYSKRGIVIVRGEGPLLFDDSGRTYIDCVAGHGSANLGHSNPAIVAAVQQQAQRLITCPEIFFNDRRAQMLERLAHISGCSKIFLSNSGTESVEAAIKIARATTGRKNLLAFMGGFHGRSLGALSATWKREYREPFLPLVPGFSHLPYNKTEGLETAITGETAAVLVEVVQGEGGVRLADKGFLQELRRLCNETGALLIFDEVQTGVGRTGRFFAHEHYGVRPDIVCLAKSLAGGVPIGATLCFCQVSIPKSSHGSTFGGNPLSCAAALAVLDVIEGSSLLEQVREKGEYFLGQLRTIDSPRIREVRGIGLMLGIELKEKAYPYLAALMDLGVLALPAGPTVIRLLPTLVITREQIDCVITALRRVLA